MTTFTPEATREDGQNRVIRTAGQSGAAGAGITVGLWAAHQLGWHGEMPAEVVLSFGVILTAAAAALTNLRRLRA